MLTKAKKQSELLEQSVSVLDELVFANDEYLFQFCKPTIQLTEQDETVLSNTSYNYVKIMLKNVVNRKMHKVSKDLQSFAKLSEYRVPIPAKKALALRAKIQKDTCPQKLVFFHQLLCVFHLRLVFLCILMSNNYFV